MKGSSVAVSALLLVLTFGHVGEAREEEKIEKKFERHVNIPKKIPMRPELIHGKSPSALVKKAQASRTKPFKPRLTPTDFITGREARTIPNPEEYANTLAGTKNQFDMSWGNTLPYLARPWGFNSWVPQTNDEGQFWFNPDDYRLLGIRCSHQPSPWINDWGRFVIQGYVGEQWGRQNGINSRKNALYRPYVFEADLFGAGDSANGKVEVTPTDHGAIMKWGFPLEEGSAEWPRLRKILFNVYDNDTATAEFDADDDTYISGYSSQNNGGVQSDFAHYFVAQVSVKPKEQIINDDTTRFYFYFEEDVTEITVRVATSLISVEQAAINFANEVATATYDDVLAESKSLWNSVMSVVDVVDVGSLTAAEEEDQLWKFYTNLAKTALFPRDLTEYDSNGENPKHYSAVKVDSPRIMDGTYFADSGFWDAYHTVYPILALLYPKQLGRIIDGYMNMADESGGWIAQWSSPGIRGSMVGTMSDASFADAIVKGIDGFDKEKAFATIWKHANDDPEDGDGGTYGRRGIANYTTLGYLPYPPHDVLGEFDEEVSRCQNYYIADYAGARAAFALNKTDEAETLLERSGRFADYFDKDVMFFRRKLEDGEFDPDWDQYRWGGNGGPFTEGSAWQFRFYVPHDPLGLAELYGGPDKFCAALDEMNEGAPIFHPGHYGQIIHEMLEMPVCGISQYGHNNQPSHPFLYMYGAVANADTSLHHETCAKKGHRYIRRTLNDVYRKDAWCGDEDNGEQGAWYVLSALGLYELMPGNSYWNIGSPLFSSVKVRPYETTTELNIVAPNNGPYRCPYVWEAKWEGVSTGLWEVEHAAMVAGGTLEFVMEACEYPGDYPYPDGSDQCPPVGGAAATSLIAAVASVGLGVLAQMF